jgi:hypothetical protein
MSKVVHLLVIMLFAVLITGAVVGILTAAAKGIFYAALLALLGIATMLYFATDGWKGGRDDK